LPKNFKKMKKFLIKPKNITIEECEKLLGKPIGTYGGKPVYRSIDVDKIYKEKKIEKSRTYNNS
jgi:hypothetical protein